MNLIIEFINLVFMKNKKMFEQLFQNCLKMILSKDKQNADYVYRFGFQEK
jgi:hypothetical protein